MADLYEARLFQFSRANGYGFVTDPDGGQDIFVHINEFSDTDREFVRDGCLVSFEVVDGDRGPRAIQAAVVRSEEDVDASQFRSQLTDALIRADGTLTTAQLDNVRNAVVELANELGLLNK